MAARFNSDNQIIVPVKPEDVRLALGRILDSKHFAHAPKKQKFLRLLCDFYTHGKAAELNEYLIGREVFDRDETYNPADDPIVRVGAHDVRKKLELYYQNEGLEDEIRLEIPVGSYEPVFNPRRSNVVEPPSPDATQTGSNGTPGLPGESTAADLSHGSDSGLSSKEHVPGLGVLSVAPPEAFARNVAKAPHRAGILFGALAGLLLVAAGWLLWNNLNLRRQVREMTAARKYAGAVWQPFLENANPALLVLSNPAVYRLGNAGDSALAVKNSVPLTEEQATALSEAYQDNFAIRNITPDPRLVVSIDTYTGIGEAIAAQRVTDLLRTTGKSVLLKRSRTVSAEDLKDHSAILFGSVWSNEWSGKLPQTEDFIYTGQATIQNHNPRDGEEREYRSKFDDRTGRLLEDYALITVKPSLSDENLLMVLSGLRSAGTEAAAEFVTSRNHLGELKRRLVEAGSPRHYQALLKVGVENGIPTTISVLAIHVLRDK